MPSRLFKKIIIVLFLGLLTTSAFLIGLKNFKNTRLHEIDEIVYVRMAAQVLKEGLAGYHTIPYGRHLAAQGRNVPEYFFQPLFKHPPAFTLLSVLSMKIFGPNPVSAEYVSLLLRVLMIPLIYLLGSHVSNKKVGLLSALFLWMDPINFICSQKVWSDSTLAFFMLLSALFFIQGLKRSNNWFFVLSGIASGLAANTKYTGILITFIIILYCLIYQRDLFKNKTFQFSLILPVLMLLPWFYWNYKIYGLTSIPKHKEFYFLCKRAVRIAPPMALVVIFIMILVWLKGPAKKFFKKAGMAFLSNDKKPDITIFIVLVTAMLMIPKQLWHSLQLTYLPTHSWLLGFFENEPATFYFGRLVEFSPVYILGFLKILTYHTQERKESLFIRLCAAMILLFFIFWGNYQSRYILPSLPFFIILAAQFLGNAYQKTLESRYGWIRAAGQSGLILVLVYICAKCYYINIMLSFPNDMAYF